MAHSFKTCTIMLNSFVALSIVLAFGCSSSEPDQGADSKTTAQANGSTDDSAEQDAANQNPATDELAGADETTDNSNKADTEPVEKREPVKERELVSMTSQEFFARAKKDESELKATLSDKLVELNGVVSRVTLNAETQIASVILQGTEYASALSFDVVFCRCAKGEKWTTVGRGQKVTVRGVDTNFIIGPSLEKCEIVKIEGEPPPNKTAEELAKAFVTDADATNAKYYEKFMVVDGEVSEKKDAGQLVLKGEGDVAFLVIPQSLTEVLFESVKVGQEVKVYGEYLEPQEKNLIRLAEALMVTDTDSSE